MQGDHHTGLLACVAGIVILLNGPAVLWHSRRTKGSHGQHSRRRMLAVVCAPVLAVAIGWFLVFPIGVGYVYTHTAPDQPSPTWGCRTRTSSSPPASGSS